MGLAMGTAIAAFAVCGTYLAPTGIDDDLTSRAIIAAWSILAPAATLMICVARLAKHRFFTPEDIDGSALTSGTERARFLQALLQNTLEQACIAVPIYVATSFVVPARLLGVVPAAAVLFVIGRALFFAGYAQGASSRAYGFALTFYPTVLMLLITLSVGVLRLLA